MSPKSCGGAWSEGTVLSPPIKNTWSSISFRHPVQMTWPWLRSSAQRVPKALYRSGRVQTPAVLSSVPPVPQRSYLRGITPFLLCSLVSCWTTSPTPPRRQCWTCHTWMQFWKIWGGLWKKQVSLSHRLLETSTVRREKLLEKLWREFGSTKLLQAAIMSEDTATRRLQKATRHPPQLCYKSEVFQRKKQQSSSSLWSWHIGVPQCSPPPEEQIDTPASEETEACRLICHGPDHLLHQQWITGWLLHHTGILHSMLLQDLFFFIVLHPSWTIIGFLLIIRWVVFQDECTFLKRIFGDMKVWSLIKYRLEW